MSYESGFAQGEQDAFHDRRNGVRAEGIDDPRTEHQRGYWDGYRPRSATWAARTQSPVVLLAWAVPT